MRVWGTRFGDGFADLIQYEMMRKWDGKMPMVTGPGATPLIDLASASRIPTPAPSPSRPAPTAVPTPTEGR